MMNQSSKSVIAVLALLVTSPAMAQHVDILVFDSDGKIGVGEFNFDTFQANEKRVHLARFSTAYVVNSPGFTSPLSLDSLPGNQSLTWDFLPLTVDSGPHAGLRSTLLYWNGTGASPEFGPTATNDYEFWISGNYGSAKTLGSNDVEPGSIISPTPPNGYIHEHPDFFLDDGDGMSETLPDAGIYVLGLRFDIDGLEQSDPVYMVWATPETSVLPAIQPAATWVRERVDSLFVDVTPGDFNSDGNVNGSDFLAWQRDHVALGDAEALTQWQANYDGGPAALGGALHVPEPTSLSLVSGVCLALMATRRRRL